jgi:hypothetical protein
MAKQGILAAVAVSAIGAGGTASAQPAPAEQPGADTPGFVTMDRGDDRSFVELGAGTTLFHGQDPDFNARVDLYGQHVTAEGIGGYASLPIAHLSDAEESESTLGNLELGGLFVLRNWAKTELVLRGGVLLPTADDDWPGFLYNYATCWGRLTDFATIMPNSTWLRLSASPIHRVGNLFVRLDAGLDVPVLEEDGADADPLLRLNVGAGLITGPVALMAELVTLATTESVENLDDDNQFIHNLALSLRGGMGGRVEGFGSLVIPIDQGGDDMVDFVLLAGARIPIGS